MCKRLLSSTSRRFLLDIGTDYYLNSELDILDEVQMIEVYHEDICNEDKDF